TELVTENKIDFNVCLNGRCVWFTVNNKMVGVFSEFENQNPYYHGIENKFDLGVYYNYTEILQALYSKDKTVSYTFNNEYANAESRGYLKYYL
ncbi:MAG: hypothetical protein J6R83_02880, partial [Clostridia bacterium]|nr:hypothetical protein [Clostridia bacterium]